jgi:hypothetical protein
MKRILGQPHHQRRPEWIGLAGVAAVSRHERQSDGARGYGAARSRAAYGYEFYSAANQRMLR